MQQLVGAKAFQHLRMCTAFASSCDWVPGMPHVATEWTVLRLCSAAACCLVCCQRMQLAAYDEDATGWLDPDALERYIAETVVKKAPSLAAMEDWFVPHYLHIAARKLLFFHGRLRGGQLQSASAGRRRERGVRTFDLVNSPVMLELQELVAGATDDGQDYSANWFSLQACTAGVPL